jgi:DtxR family Mn-dependent transcriptional regulator
MLSFTEENYIKAIYSLAKETKEAVTTTSIAERLQTTPGSVSDMLKKLSVKKLINHEKYQGVVLTETGKSFALNIIRKHRLWEVFLVDKLEFKWDEVHEIAEQLEHIQSEKLIERLDKFLGHPTSDPHGDPIPNVNGKMRELKTIPLNELPVKKEAIVTGVKESSAVFLQYLNKVGIGIGTKIKINDVVEFDGSAEVSVNKNKSVMLSKTVSKNILVQNIS